MAIYDEVNGVARKITKKYDGVNGIAREVSKVYDGVNDVARLVYSDNADSGDSGVTTTVNIAGTLLTTTSSNPVLYFDSGSGQFTLDGESVNPTSTYPAEAIPLLGAPSLSSGSANLTAGGTYYYTYYFDDGSPQFAVMINQKGNIIWERAIAGCFYITWTSGSSVQIGGSSTEYYCDTAFVGLSTKDDKNVSSDLDIPYSTNIDIGWANSDKRSYIYYLYDDTDIVNGTVTTVIVYDASGTHRGTLQTTDANPTMKMEMNDSGELYLKGGVGVQGDGLWYYEYSSYGQGISIAVNAWRPVGLSVANDGNITSEGDLEYNTDEISLEAGKTYTYYTYGEDDLQSESSGLLCPSCGATSENYNISYNDSDGGMHTLDCLMCGNQTTYVCYDDDMDGYCDACGHSM